ncbi:FxSxx-COOH system tetratricopeptide repeat protein [Streptomyces mirabilis]|uniref:FxSxx-COOH system tetratricopeptide repeat protein n=1 Tax=Streptomyces mirabilis TaxID=68239 RepID=UPI0036829EA3
MLHSVDLTAVSAGRDLRIDQRTVHQLIEVGTLQPERRPPPTRPVRLAPRPPRLAGREGLLAVIRDRLTSLGPSPRLLALHGLGGVGKTSVAVEYAHRHQDDYGLIWQLAAEDTTTLSASYGELATLLGARDLVDSADPVAQVHAALAARADRWLLLLDNVADAAAVRDLLPPAGDGHVLLTTRSAHWPDTLDLEVPVLDREVAAEYLMASAAEGDAQSAATLASELGSLPLALDQAASYLRATGRKLHEYLELLREHRAELLGRGLPWGYSAPVLSTWDLSLQRLQTSDPAAITLLWLLACCAPEAIPYRLLLPPANEPPVFEDAGIGPLVEPLLQDVFAVEDAIIGLRRFSLVGPPSEGAVSMHRLVQAVTLDRLRSEHRGAWRRAVATLVEAAMPDDPYRPETWTVYATLFPHARATLRPDRPSVLKLVDYLGASGDYRTAQTVQEEVYTANVERLGAEHPDALRAHAALAKWTGMAGDPATARDMLTLLLPVCDRVWGSDTAETLSVAAHLADWTGQAGDWARARDICAVVLPRRRSVSGDEHPDTLWVWAELGFWTGQAGDAASARVHYDEFLPIMERVLGAEHPDVLSSRDQYVRWVGETGDPAAARDVCASLLALHERISGAEHHGTLWIRASHAWWMGKAGDPAAARDHLAQLLSIREHVSGPEHPATLVVRGNLAYWTAHAGDPASARDQFAALLPIRQRILGPEHPETLLVQSNLIHWAGEAGDPAGARDQFTVMLASCERTLGPKHWVTLNVRDKLAMWTARCGG